MTAPFDAERIAAAASALNKPIAVAEGLPGWCYGADFHAIEQQRLFPRSWCAVAVGNAIPNPGDVLPIDVAGWPVLVVRTREGEVRAFHNICRHRGIQLVTEPCNTPRLRCPWHSWTYGLDGALLATPELGGAGIARVEGFDKAALGLKPIPVGRWLDLIFVNIDGQATPFADYIAPVETLFADHDLDDLRYGMPILDSYAGNWKIAMEGGIEDYHLTFAHPELDAHLFRNTTPCVHPGSYAGGATDVSPEAGGEEGQLAWTARLPGLRTRDGGPLPRLHALTLFPTATILIAADHVMLGTLLPDGPTRTRVDIHLYFDGAAAADPALAEARAGTLAMWHTVLPQDMPFIAAAQKTIGAREAAGVATRFSPYWEAGVRGFQQMVLAAVA
jgi:choline monooxygenase